MSITHTRLTVVSIVFTSIFASAATPNSTGLIAFAQQNAEKFKNEIIETSGLNISSRVSLQGRMDEPSLFQYDAESGELVFSDFSSFPFLIFSESCKAIGSFVGQNSFGAKVTVRREKCERFVASDGDVTGPRLNRTRIKMSPSQFREIKRSGVKAEIDFTIGHPKLQQVVDFSDSLSDARVDFPVQSRMRVWTVFGQINEVRWLLPGEKQAVRIWQEESPSPTGTIGDAAARMQSAQPAGASSQPTVSMALGFPSATHEQQTVAPREKQDEAAKTEDDLRPFLAVIPSFAPIANTAVWFKSEEAAASAGRLNASVMGVACKGGRKLVVAIGTGFAIKNTFSITPPLTDVRYYFDTGDSHRNWEKFGPSEAGPMAFLDGFMASLKTSKILKVAFEREGKSDRESVTFKLDNPAVQERLTALMETCH